MTLCVCVCGGARRSPLTWRSGSPHGARSRPSSTMASARTTSLCKVARAQPPLCYAGWLTPLTTSCRAAGAGHPCDQHARGAVRCHCRHGLGPVDGLRSPDSPGAMKRGGGGMEGRWGKGECSRGGVRADCVCAGSLCRATATAPRATSLSTRTCCSWERPSLARRWGLWG